MWGKCRVRGRVDVGIRLAEMRKCFLLPWGWGADFPEKRIFDLGSESEVCREDKMRKAEGTECAKTQ